MLTAPMTVRQPLAAPLALLWTALAAAGPQDPPVGPPALAPDPPPRTLEEPGSAGGTVRVLNLTLAQAVDLALASDLGLGIQEEAVNLARFQFVGSWGAFDPVVRANAAYIDSESQARNQFAGATVVEEETWDVSGGLFVPLLTGGDLEATYQRLNTETNNQFQLINPSTTDLVGLTFRQPLLRGAWSRYATSLQTIAELDYERAREQMRQTRQDLIRGVEDAYWDLVAAIQQLEVAEASLQLSRQQLDQNQRRLDAGVGTQVEVLQAETSVAQQVQERLLREVLVRDAGDLLKARLFPGKDVAAWNAQILPVTPLPVVSTQLVPTWESALVVALDQRSALRQQRFQIRADELRLGRAASERRPVLDLVLSSQATGFDGDPADAFESAATFEFPRNTASLSFSYPLLNRAAANAERAARAQLRASRLTYDQVESGIVGEVRAAVRNLLYQAEAVRAAEKSSELARRQLEAEQARFREGLSTNFQVLEFQEQLSRALFSATRARADFAKAVTGLLHAEGVLGEVRRP